MNMRNFVRRNVRKYRDIKGSDKCITLEISLKFDSKNKMRIKCSNPKDSLGIPGKRLITSLGLKAKAWPNKYKKARYAIGNSSMKDLSNIIREFGNFTYKSYDRRRPKLEPTEG